MATATMQEPAAGQVERGADAAGLEFLIFEDNGGDYRWTIVDADGESLAQSGFFATYHDAERGALLVQAWGVSDRPKRRSATHRSTADRRKPPAANHDADAKGSLDKRGRS